MRTLSARGLVGFGLACVSVAALLLNVTLASEDYRLVLAASLVLLAFSVALFVAALRRRAGVLVSLLALGGTLLVVFFLLDIAHRTPSALSGFGPGEIFILPDSYIGWVRVMYGVPGRPSAREEEGGRVVVVPESGEASTSAPPARPKPSDRFFYQHDAARVAAQVDYRGPLYRLPQNAFFERCFFVGSTGELRRSLEAGVAQCSPGRLNPNGLLAP